MRLLGVVTLGVALILSACGGSGEPEAPTPNIGAEVRTAVAAAFLMNSGGFTTLAT